MRDRNCNRSRKCFNPRPPCGGRLYLDSVWMGWNRFQSTPPMRRATDRSITWVNCEFVSIHAPHAEGDLAGEVRRGAQAQVSIHAPHAEGDDRLTAM